MLRRHQLQGHRISLDDPPAQEGPEHEQERDDPDFHVPPPNTTGRSCRSLVAAARVPHTTTHGCGEQGTIGWSAWRAALSENSKVIVNIARRADWEVAAQRGSYESDSLADEGFIHCSEPHQVVDTANALFRGQSGLVLLCIDPTRLDAPLRYEASKRGTFPHVYGPLNVGAVTAVLEFSPRADGTFELPPNIPVSASG